MKQRKANRLKGYDYSQDNLYFVTSCVQDMICCFGDIVVGTGRDLSLKESPQMILNEYGKIADQQWLWLGEQYPYINLHEFIVMPNHIHGIIEIVGTGRELSNDRDKNRTGHELSEQNLSNDRNKNRTGHDLSLQGKIKSLSELMGAYKMTVSKQIHLLGYDEFKWQRSFYDNIIRDEKSYERISNYIINNPNSWDQDKFFM